MTKCRNCRSPISSNEHGDFCSQECTDVGVLPGETNVVQLELDFEPGPLFQVVSEEQRRATRAHGYSPRRR